MTRLDRLTTAACRALMGMVFCAGSTVADADSRCPRALTAAIPPRATNMPSGTAFARSIAQKVREQRDGLSANAILRGDIPNFLRSLQAVTLHAYAADGEALTATICVMPDYLAIGSDSDFLRIPLAFATAATVAAGFGFVLPTPRMVDAIYRHAAVHLRPQPLHASDSMRSTAYFTRHNDDISAQIKTRGIPPGTFLAGHKKDVVLSTRLDSRPDREAIYGWQEPNGAPIQSLSTRHGVAYVDYSHGIRLISDVMLLNGKVTSIHHVLADPRLAVVLSDEGVVASLRRYIPAKPQHLARLQEAMLAASISSEP